MRGLEMIAAGRPQLDLAEPATIAMVIGQVEPDVVVNAAAYTAVDKAEQEPERAQIVNAGGAGHIAAACQRRGIPLIHLSTDYVFDGSKDAAYVETDPVAPLGAYGRSKLEGERRIAAACSHHVILRTSWVVSPYGNNFVKTMLRLAETHPEIGVVNDQTGTPTYAPHLAGAILSIAAHLHQSAGGLWGIYHAAGTGEATWHDVACEVFAQSAQLGGRVTKVRPITTSAYPTPAARPKNSRLDCGKLDRQFGLRLPDWRLGIAACVRALAADITPVDLPRKSEGPF